MSTLVYQDYGFFHDPSLKKYIMITSSVSKCRQSLGNFMQSNIWCYEKQYIYLKIKLFHSITSKDCCLSTIGFRVGTRKTFTCLKSVMEIL